MGLTKFVLKKPVTTILVVLCLFVFGISSLMSSKLELIPDMEMPVFLISTIYPGASPEDVNDLVTQEIEDSIGSLSGIDTVTSYSQENVSIIVLQYNYGTDMDQAYDDLKKKMDSVSTSLPDDANDPSIMEFNINDTPSISLSVNNSTESNLYNYVNDVIAPEFEKISSVSSVNVSGGQKEYIQVALIPEKLSQYGLTMKGISDTIGSADFTYPAGSTIVGRQSLSVSAGTDYATLDSLKQIPITTGSGSIVYLEDIANITTALDDASGIARYNGQETISVDIMKQQSATAVEVSNSVNETIRKLMAQDENLEIVVVNDTSNDIKSSLTSVFQTMVMAIIVSMIIIFLFFGEFKASMIVGTSIPISIMAALIVMSTMGFSLNVITMSSLVLGVGMMVDNSIVVLESCFRATKGKGIVGYREAALEGSRIVIQSIIGSTATTCVVFLPLAFLSGMTGQMFQPLGFTIVFCMLASLVSAMTIVPLCYCMYRPREKENAPVSGLMNRMQNGYRNIMKSIIRKKKTVMFVSVAMLVFSFFLATQLKMELMPADDTGTITITANIRPGLTTEESSKVLEKIETYITQDPNLESYMLTLGGSGLSLSGSGTGTITAYLIDDRTMETDDVVNVWKKDLQSFSDCNVTVEASSSMSMMGSNGGGVEYILQGTQYDELKSVSDTISKELSDRPEVTKIHTSLENAAPVVKLNIDTLKADAEHISPLQIASGISNILGGIEATTLKIDGNDVSVMVEYPKDEYDTIEELQGIVLPTNTGGSVALTDVADIVYKDSPVSISRVDKQYQVTITGDYTEAAGSTVKARTKTDQILYNEVVSKNMTPTISRAMNSMDTMMQKEFSALFGAIATAVFLIFVVMAAQFESPKFSIMVMTTIPFALIGSFSLLYLADVSISMTSLLGFLMLVGTVVNNGILYVDTANQLRSEMDLSDAVIEAGAIRLRPILMTTLTTIVAMIPMCLAYGDAGATMQGLALVDVGGLVASTILALLMLPVYYLLMNRRKKPEPSYD